MTKAEFVEDGLFELDNSFNASRPEGKRVKKKNHWRAKRGLERGYDLREMGKDPDTIRVEVKKAMFGSGLIMMLLSFIIQNWGDDLVAFILKLLFPTMFGAAPSEVWFVGRHIMDVPGGIAWEFQGVFHDKAKAIAACRDATYFVAPATVGESIAHETHDWQGCYYPLVT